MKSLFLKFFSVISFYMLNPKCRDLVRRLIELEFLQSSMYFERSKAAPAQRYQTTILLKHLRAK
ncbi:MAG TPA: hypothetical protein DEP53_06185 [Bacteroidetes bacterium]|nr:MAG: hypothetical protein A2X66_05520 [Ignavibacteria bacterium GWA2_54_16]HCA79307.1 hypothetical protein [Bacteroidota bacterium]